GPGRTGGTPAARRGGGAVLARVQREGPVRGSTGEGAREHRRGAEPARRTPPHGGDRPQALAHAGRDRFGGPPGGGSAQRRGLRRPTRPEPGGAGGAPRAWRRIAGPITPQGRDSRRRARR